MNVRLIKRLGVIPMNSISREETVRAKMARPFLFSIVLQMEIR